jgi:protein KRI1
MYGEKLEDVKSESSSSDDDSDAELLNPLVDKKIFEVLNAIKNNDPKLLKEEKPLFDDEDFEKGQSREKSAKAFTLKD